MQAGKNLFKNLNINLKTILKIIPRDRKNLPRIKVMREKNS